MWAKSSQTTWEWATIIFVIIQGSEVTSSRIELWVTFCFLYLHENFSVVRSGTLSWMCFCAHFKNVFFFVAGNFDQQFCNLIIFFKRQEFYRNREKLLEPKFDARLCLENDKFHENKTISGGFCRAPLIYNQRFEFRLLLVSRNSLFYPRDVFFFLEKYQQSTAFILNKRTFLSTWSHRTCFDSKGNWLWKPQKRCWMAS